MHGTFDDIRGLASPDLRPVCQALRDLIAVEDPAFVEVIWPKLKIASFGVGPKKNTQHYAYIAVQSAHVNLGFYHGTALNDPTRMLEGSGKTLRHVKVRDLAGAEDGSLALILRQAIAEREAYR